MMGFVNVASAAALVAFAAMVKPSSGQISATPQFTVNGAQHASKKEHHHLRHPSHFNVDEYRGRLEKGKARGWAPGLPAAPQEQVQHSYYHSGYDEKGAGTASTGLEPFHAEAEPHAHSGSPGEGGDPMVPRAHEHGKVTDEEDHGWSYAYTQEWKINYKDCGGTKQSPIDLSSELSKAKDAGNGSLSSAISYTSMCDAHIDNNGHNLQVNGAFGNLSIPSGMHYAAQFNFHFPSEHKVDGKRAAAELQIVHQKENQDGTSGLAIIAILFKVEDVFEEANGGEIPSHVRSEIHFLQQLGFPAPEVLTAPAPSPDETVSFKLTGDDQLKADVETEEKEKEEEEEDEEEAEEKVANEKASPPAPSLIQMRGDPPSSPADPPAAAAPLPAIPAAAPAPAPPPPALPEKHVRYAINSTIDIGAAFAYEFEGGYWHYQGSLTSPPCSETVEWFVLARQAAVTQEMVDRFKELYPNPANSRPIQPINDRPIVWSKADEFEPAAKDATKSIGIYLGLFCVLFVYWL